MYLKRLELHGFKTFATRTVLDFEGGVMAVVGPNGSGKSNLADAIRWALGEQTMRNVRSRHADDLIFAGTGREGNPARVGGRAPMGMAEVMLTFDNAAGWLPVDFAEVRIGRRVYRGGENEYVMNGARVRLRDITDLLARAAVSAGGHLVIGQGLIDTVLSLRPEDRRGLIETLAGLRFYYGRREDAEVKLRLTESNLQRVDTMIAEAAPYLAALHEQAAAYDRYHAVARELRDLLVVHYAHAYAQATEKRARLAGEQDTTQQALGAIRAAVRDADAALSAARERARLLAHEVDGLRRALRAAHEAHEAAERELAVSQTRRSDFAGRLEDLHTALPALEARRVEAVAEATRAHEGMRLVEAERGRLHEARGPMERAVQEANGAVAAAERAVRQLAEQRHMLEGQETTAVAELAVLAREDVAARAESGRHAADERAAVEGLHATEEAIVAARSALQAAATRGEEARAGEARARGEAAGAADAARGAADERGGLERRVEELCARADGLRAWLHAVGGAGNVGGPTVATMLAVAPELAPALAAALGPVLTARAAAPEIDAPAATALLDAGARGVLVAGRSGLGATAQQALQGHLDAAGIARDQIAGWGDRVARIEAPESDEAAGRAIWAIRAVLSTVLVVRDMATLWRVHAVLATSAGREVRGGADGAVIVLATCAGEALLPNGLLYRPGRTEEEALRRAREVRDVEAAAVTAGERLRGAVVAAERAERERLERATAAEAALHALRAAERDHGTRRVDLAAAERTAMQARREAEWAAERVRRAAAARSARAERRGQMESRRGEAQRLLAALATEEIPALARHEAARARLREEAARRAEHGAALALIAERAAEAQRRCRAADEAAVRLADELRARGERLARLEAEAREIGARADGAAVAVAATMERLQAVQRQVRPRETELAAVEARAAELERHLTALRPREARAGAAHEATVLAGQRAVHDLESVLAGLESDLALDPADLPPSAPPPAGLLGRARALRAQLAAFAPVNARAPEDLAAAAERQQFLHEQAADLREGLARLRGLIAEANGTVRERFGAVAGELDAQFRLYLQRLFDGGHGAITALYDAAGLPSGLDIAVQPPGKRTSDLALLSGGERALVGLALVFAMLAVRPVPFCVLDEAEAALDEANTMRVGDILRGLSTRTQFVVITHNRGTMSHADVLYGVTMGESGVSQVAGLRLEDVEIVRRNRAG